MQHPKILRKAYLWGFNIMCYSGQCSHENYDGECTKRRTDVCPIDEVEEEQGEEE